MTSHKEIVIADSLPSEHLFSSHKIATLVRILENDDEIVTTVDTVLSGSVNCDSSSESLRSADLSIIDDGTLGWVPTDPSKPLAPYGNEFQIYRGIEYWDRYELVSLGIFQIQRPRASDTPEGISISVTGPDRSQRLIDAAFEEDGQVASGTNVVTAISDLLQEAWPNIPLNLAASAVTLPLLTYSAGDSRWAFVQGLAISIGGELFFDNNGICVLRPVPTITQNSNPVASFEEGEGGALLGIEREWDRQRVYNRAIVTGENVSQSGTPPRAVATDDNPLSPTYYYGKFGRKPKFYTNPYITTSTQCTDASNGLLARTIGAPDSISFESLVDPARAPSDVVRIKRDRLEVDEDHILDSVQIPLGPESGMSCTTRVAQEFS